jgi:hypothetical protein
MYEDERNEKRRESYKITGEVLDENCINPPKEN